MINVGVRIVVSTCGYAVDLALSPEALVHCVSFVSCFPYPHHLLAGPVGDLFFSDVLLDSVNVSWTPPSQPHGRIVRYIVNYNTYKLHVSDLLENLAFIKPII